MNRYILWSVVFHITVVLGGALLAPMSGLITSAPRSEMIISVGLVDAPDMGGAPGTQKAETPKEEPVAAPPKLSAPEPALDADLAVKPIADLTKEKVAEQTKKETPKKEPKKETPKKEPPKTETRKESKPGSNEPSAQQLATADTAGMRGSISEGSGGGGDVWGVEGGPSVSPYHRRGFAAIRSNWRNPAVGVKPIKCSVRFTVKRTGEITDIDLETRSGNELFDRAALRAVQLTQTWEQFPSFWPEDEQVIILDFEYRP